MEEIQLENDDKFEAVLEIDTQDDHKKGDGTVKQNHDKVGIGDHEDDCDFDGEGSEDKDGLDVRLSNSVICDESVVVFDSRDLAQDNGQDANESSDNETSDVEINKESPNVAVAQNYSTGETTEGQNVLSV